RLSPAPNPQLQLLVKIQKEKLRLMMDQATDYMAVQQKLFDSFIRDVGKKNEALQTLLPQLIREDPATLAQKLKDPDPFVRWVAIQVAARKWMPVEKELVTLIADPYPGVREAAQQALVRLSRGSDFGPPATATPGQVEQAQAQWQRWLDLQFTA